MARHLFTGVTEATMTHNESWHFCRLRRMLEPADKTSRILDVRCFLLLPAAADIGTASDDIQWAAVSTAWCVRANARTPFLERRPRSTGIRWSD
jgi:uncharacterized alpha-E superfamily protein